LALTFKDVEWLRSILNIDADELSRNLATDEALAWSFYRTSGRHPVEVWQNAMGLARDSGLSQRDVSAVVGVDQANINRVVAGK
jgi:hypothetical protein